MWASATQLVTAVVSIVSLVWLIVSQVRSSSARKHADRAETAARLLATLEKIGVGGIDSRFDGSFAREIHAGQVHRLQEVVRVNTAEFERRAQRVGWSLSFHLLIGIYGVLLITSVIGPVRGLGDLPADEQWIGIVLYGGLIALSIAIIGGLVSALRRRHIAREVGRKAGKYVPDMLEIVSTSVVGFTLWRHRRRERRAETAALSVQGPAEVQIDQPLPEMPVCVPGTLVRDAEPDRADQVAHSHT